MTLLQTFLALTQSWRSVFAQQRTWLRAQRQALGSLLVLGRATLSRILWTNGRQQKSWSGEYFLHSRARWSPQALFAPLLKEALSFCPGRLLGVAVDDTRLRKTGRCIPQAAYHRDPLSPPFHTNLMLGLRFLQASLLLPLHRSGPFSARAIPIRFEEAQPARLPGSLEAISRGPQTLQPLATLCPNHGSATNHGGRKRGPKQDSRHRRRRQLL